MWTAYTIVRVRFFRKSKIKFLNPKWILRFFLLNRSIQDLSDHGASKELKNPLRLVVDSSVS